MTDTLKRNAHLVEALGSALREGDHALGTVPGLIKRVLAEGSWQEFVTQRGELVQHARFADFVTTPPLKGIGASVDLIRRIIEADTQALDLLDQALQNPVGRPGTLDNIQDRAATGTSKDAALRKLRKDAPELHGDVLAGRLSAHGAMVKAGFRRRTFSVPAGDPVRTAATLRRQLTAQELAALVALLTEQDG